MLIPLLAVAGFVAADVEAELTLRYVRRAKDIYVLESLVTTSTKGKIKTYTSVTDRGSEKLTLTVRFDDGKLKDAVVVQEQGAKKNTASLTRGDASAKLQRGEKVEELPDVGSDSIVTSAPDWSDIFLLVQRYDAVRAGKQEHPGLWIHPVKATLRLRFSVERLGKDTLRSAGKALELDRYRIRLRSGDYIAWADSSRRVIKLAPAGGPMAEVVLKGFEESARILRP